VGNDSFELRDLEGVAAFSWEFNFRLWLARYDILYTKIIKRVKEARGEEEVKDTLRGVMTHYLTKPQLPGLGRLARGIVNAGECQLVIAPYFAHPQNENRGADRLFTS
jgi:hypothetical protein